jgi:carbamoyl-phosphate synthase/aspartate carbamoyltransferase
LKELYTFSRCQLPSPLLFYILLSLDNRSWQVDTLEELAMLRKAKQKGVQVTCGVLLSKLLSPAGDHLWAHMDVIDCFSFSASEGQSLAVEYALPLLFHAMKQGRITLEHVVDKLHTRPSQVFGIPVQANTSVQVDLHDASKIPTDANGPFADRSLSGKVRRVLIRNHAVMIDGSVHIVESGIHIRQSEHPRLQRLSSSNEEPTSPTRSRSVNLLPLSPTNVPMSPLGGGRDLGDSVRLGKLVPSRVLDLDDGFTPAEADDFMQPAETHETLSVASVPLASVQHLDLGLDLTSSGSANYFRGKHILSATQFGKPEMKVLFMLATDMKNMVERTGSADLLKGKVLANVFYEPSTRTAFSFEAAMYRLGGRVLNMTEIEKTAVKRGESLQDTMRTMASYCDVLVLRHPDHGSVQQVPAFSASHLSESSHRHHHMIDSRSAGRTPYQDSHY